MYEFTIFIYGIICLILFTLWLFIILAESDSSRDIDYIWSIVFIIVWPLVLLFLIFIIFVSFGTLFYEKIRIRIINGFKKESSGDN